MEEVLLDITVIPKSSQSKIIIKDDIIKAYLHSPPDKNKANNSFIDPIKTEKDKARKLRQSPWWKKKLSEGVCYYCGNSFSSEDLTMDHKIPLSRGGISEKINLVTACKECNNKKKYLLPTEWEEYLNRLKKCNY